MYQQSEIRVGMKVRSDDGEKLGKILALGDGEFVIGQGSFFLKDYAIHYTDIREIRGDKVFLKQSKEALLRSLSGKDPRTEQTKGAGQSLEGSGGEVAVPVHKEELDVIKRDRQTGEVHVHKSVVEEEKEITVPVRRERVQVERRDVSDRPAQHASFQEETVVVPLHAEEVEVRKRPVVSEEVVIHKDAIKAEKRVAGTVRREEVEVRNEGEAEERKLDMPPEEPGQRRS